MAIVIYSFSGFYIKTHIQSVYNLLNMDPPVLHISSMYTHTHTHTHIYIYI